MYSFAIGITFGPHVKENFLTKPVKYYNNSHQYRSSIIKENKNRAIIYQWTCLITGKTYVGSANNGATRLNSYWYPSILSCNLPIYTSIAYYSHANHSLAVLEDIGTTGNVSKTYILEREQHYLDMLFSDYADLALNLSVTAGSTLGVKHSREFSAKRSAVLNPMYAISKSPKFIAMQIKDKKGINNPQYNVVKSPSTIAKLTKLIYVYDSVTNSFLGAYSTVECSKHYNMGKDTLQKYLNTGQPFKGRLF